MSYLISVWKSRQKGQQQEEWGRSFEKELYVKPDYIDETRNELGSRCKICTPRKGLRDDDQGNSFSTVFDFHSKEGGGNLLLAALISTGHFPFYWPLPSIVRLGLQCTALSLGWHICGVHFKEWLILASKILGGGDKLIDVPMNEVRSFKPEQSIEFGLLSCN